VQKILEFMLLIPTKLVWDGLFCKATKYRLHILGCAILVPKTINIWQGLRYANGTLGEWVKKSDEEFAAIEEEIREIRELLDEDF